MICAYPSGQCLASLFLNSRWVAQGSDCKLESWITGFMITTVHQNVGKKLGSTAPFVPNDFEAIGVKRRKHNLFSQAFPSSIDQKVPVFLLADRKGRPLPSVGGASPAPSAPACGSCVPALPRDRLDGTWHPCANGCITSPGSSVCTD